MSPVQKTWVLLIATLALGLAALFLYYFSVSIYPLPRWDHYMWIAGYLDADSVLTWLWEPHNVHRIVPTRLLVMLDIELFRGALLPIAIASVAMPVGWTVIIFCTVRGTGELGIDELTAFSSLLVAISFQTFTLDSFTYPANNAFPVSIFLFVSATCAAIASARTEDGASIGVVWLVISLLAATGCSITALNGLFVWPLLIYLFWKGRYTLGIASAAAVGLITILLYIPGLPSLASSPGQGSFLEAVYRYARYFVAYFGMPWVALPRIAVLGYLVGITVVLLALSAMLKAGTDRNNRHPLQDIGLALLLFAFLTAAMTTVGRSAEFDLPAHRYTVFAVAGHMGLLCFYWPDIWRHFRFMTGLRLGKVALVAVGVVLLCQQVAVGKFAYSRAREFEQIKKSILAGDRSVELVETVYFDHDEHLRHLELLQRERLYLYREMPQE